MDIEGFVDEVCRRGAFERADEARLVIEIVLGSLAEFLVRDEAIALADALGGRLGAVIIDNAGGSAPNRAALYDRVAARESVPLGRAAEYTQIVLESIGKQLPDATRLRLLRHLGAEMGELFKERPLPEEPPVRVHLPPDEPGKGHTLSTGKPGSRHPLSEARPERAHQHSVARSEHPHEETKLSSSAGMTQEREHETLAEGHPGPKRPLSEGR